MRTYYREVFEEDLTWRHDEVVLRCPRVHILCEYDYEPEDLIEGVTCDLDAGNLETTLTADDGGEGFTAGELLFKIHNAFSLYLREGDHNFFEGLARVQRRKADPNAPPVYEVMTGS